MAGLGDLDAFQVPHNLRLTPEPAPEPAGDDLDILVDAEGDLDLDADSKVLEIKHSDGSITINLGGAKRQPKDTKFDDNLAESLSEYVMNAIADDLLRGIAQDESSRSEWMEDRAEGIKLLGLRVEKPRSGVDTGGSSAPLEGMSTVRHPALLEAVLRFQANARGELLPSDGPVKVRNDNNGLSNADIAGIGHNGGPPMAKPGLDQDDLAEALEKDMNHYLTSIATEYYPDTDRMLLMVGFGGCGFKKGYHCPIRNRPAIESVDAADLIVSNAATDLTNSTRVTHVVRMKASTLKRMQLLGEYREVDLVEPGYDDRNPVEREVDEVQGVRPQPDPTPALRERTIYECYCELDIEGFEHKDDKGKVTGLPVPYQVVIDKASRTVLAIKRNWKEGDKLCLPRRRFVKYPFVPGFGFYDIGLVHILGNSTAALTAAWREMLDAGMFANFPGFLFAKVAGRQETNQFRVPPGGGVPIDTQGQPISQVVMPLPYKGPDPALIQLADNIAQNAQRVGGTAEVQVGEGRQDAPVGTTIALIEQAQKVLDAVHKRIHAAQAEEFQMLKELFQEDPEALYRANRNPQRKWNAQMVMEALADTDLVPVADPNTSSHMMRVMKAQALVVLSQTAPPGVFDMQEVYRRALAMIAMANPDQLVPIGGVPTGQQRQTDPKAQAAMMKAQADAALGQGKLQLEQQRAQLEQQRAQAEMQLRATEIQAGAQMKAMDTQQKAGALQQQAEEAERQRQHERDIAAANMQAEQAQNSYQHAMEIARVHAESRRAQDEAGLAQMAEAHETQRAAAALASQQQIAREHNETQLEIAEGKRESDAERARMQANKPKPTKGDE